MIRSGWTGWAIVAAMLLIQGCKTTDSEKQPPELADDWARGAPAATAEPARSPRIPAGARPASMRPAPTATRRIPSPRSDRSPSRPVRVQPTPRTPIAAAPASTPTTPTRAALPPMNASGVSTAGAVSIEVHCPAEVRTNVPFEYAIDVSNRSGAPAREVQVVHEVPDGVKVTASAPAVDKSSSGELRWDIGTLEANAARRIRVQAVVKEDGPITACAVARFVTQACAETRAGTPKLEMDLEHEPELTSCERVPFVVTVRNTGTAAAPGVRGTVQFPDGLRDPQGQPTVPFDFGEIPAGEERTIQITGVPAVLGEQPVTTRVAADGMEPVEKTSKVKIVQPVLALTGTGVETAVVARPFEHTYELKNTGDGPARALAVRGVVSEGARIVAVSGNGTVEGQTVLWERDELGPGSSADYSLRLSADQPMVVTSRLTAQGTCAQQVSASARTQVKGVPAILLEVVDNEDPVEVGDETTYEITITNQGSMTGTNIVIACILEETQRYRSVQGPTQPTVEGSTITFKPVPQLRPGDEATYKIKVAALATGDVRFTVRMTSDQLQRPVEETESTYQY